MRAKLTVVVTLVLLAAFLTAGAGQAAPPEAGGGVHIVQWGENLAAIAFQYGTTVAAICQANGLRDPNLIYIGQRLVVPGATGRPPLPQQGAMYTVRRGDTLTNIGLRYGVPLEVLMQANNTPGGFIYAGQQLMIPGDPQAGMLPGPQGAMPPGPEAAMPPGPRQMPQAGLPMQTVAPGDTLSALAFRYGTTVNDIMRANNLYNPWIFTGQKLVIPTAAGGNFEQPAGTTHIVQVGDTLAGLALRYGTTVQVILQANGISQANFIVPGQQLVIPGMMRPQGNPDGGQMAVQGFKLGPPAAQQGPNPGAPQGMIDPRTAPLLGNGPESGNPNLIIAPIAPPGSGNVVQGPPAGYGNGVQAPPPGYGQMPPILSESGQPLQGYAPGPQGLPGSPLIGEVGPLNALPLGANPVAPPVITQKWVGRLVSESQPEGNRYVGVLRVLAGGAAGMQVTVRRDEGDWSTTGFTGNKPEYGEGMAEFAPIGSGTFVITLDGQVGSNGKAPAALRLKILPHALTYVQFDQVPNGTQ